jgi:alkanesulfonate monooxygenase SsuD/methylene tetrahydromethanopterin reductase-like flavin-dependent oxidoreductase (luciferase family)
VVGQAEVGQSQATFVRHYREAGGTGNTRGVRLVFVAPTHAAALEQSTAAADLYFKLMANNGYRKNAIEKGYLPAEISSREDMLLHINFIAGTPDDVAAQLNRYVASTGVDQLDAMVKIPLLRLEDVHASMRLLQHEVRPQLVFGNSTAESVAAE